MVPLEVFITVISMRSHTSFEDLTFILWLTFSEQPAIIKNLRLLRTCRYEIKEVKIFMKLS